jgi:ABC-type transporter Mla MlaB component
VVHVVVESRTGEPLSVTSAPQDVTIRLGRIGYAEVNELRRLLRELIRTAPRTVDIDLSGLDRTHKPAVFAVVIGAARDARNHGSTIRVRRPPTDLRRGFALARIAETAPATDSSYEVLLGKQSSPSVRTTIPAALLPTATV